MTLGPYLELTLMAMPVRRLPLEDTVRVSDLHDFWYEAELHATQTSWNHFIHRGVGAPIFPVLYATVQFPWKSCVARQMSCPAWQPRCLTGRHSSSGMQNMMFAGQRTTCDVSCGLFHPYHMSHTAIASSFLISVIVRTAGGHLPGPVAPHAVVPEWRLTARGAVRRCRLGRLPLHRCA